MINLFDIQNTSSSSLVVAPLKKSVFGSLRGKKNRGSGQSSTSLPRNVTLDGVVDSKETAGASELMKDSLQITIRVEIDQKNPSGKTKPYRFLIPVLNYDDSSSAGVKRMSRSI